MGTISDFELYERIQKDDREALELLYERYEKLLYSFAFKILQQKELSEDAVQEVFIKIWRNKRTYSKEKGKFSSWMLTVTRNACIDLLRKRSKTETELSDENLQIPASENVEKTVEWREEREQLQSAISTLSEEQKKMVELFYFKGESQQKISESCGVPLGTVKGRIRLALQHLRKKYNEGRDKYGQEPM
ncbi:RNA polymerase sigma factor [Fictibacillus aquaticus]|uniref:RNA polymerase subunit sigma-70 n=1 Tax=Fictibacillus aquaticus TaxID=2021314 RepID=A0A235FF82_9BACL|nr:sigma-70 family RNA polymerase sigma factor [Fictibacillus aquaticus]OYD59653.1 RNA polymerase subunit sigma-70 [Fictibacillus aquaticus]